MRPDCGTTTNEPAAFRGGRLWRARHRGERGQAVTEFAMVLPLFAILVLVCILFGKALYVYIQLTHTANEAARLASVDYPGAGANLCTILQSENAIPKGITLTFSYPDNSSRAVGEPVTVTASADGSWVPVINVGTLTASATMRLEQSTTGNTIFGTTCTAA